MPLLSVVVPPMLINHSLDKLVLLIEHIGPLAIITVYNEGNLAYFYLPKPVLGYDVQNLSRLLNGSSKGYHIHRIGETYFPDNALDGSIFEGKEWTNPIK
ncbi:hypothetical protein FOXG_16188 [Fusarium oxysporum f. sp. lycopersici 4287]|uniref:Uncharacterized protein n=2 Tax=Fusarium oxysporum TaxID=5507 RepID=A0A0J9W7S5_FUSO4|nr:hypothetical protein FOXG_16188 [Fusarium oxysporum f. sp. lycopersici 4287]KNB18755.1 hypothetical protein FOXG_16188 [Fusarium oxysporum f. sp. lycopersici 4287]